MKKISKMVYEAPFVEVVPYVDEVMEAHGAVSRYWTGNPDEKPEKPSEDPPPGGWGDWTAKDFAFDQDVEDLDWN